MIKKKSRKTEFSKKILIVIAISTILIVIFSLIVVWKTKDTSPLAYIIPAVFVELATATGFYYRKAQKENELKIPHYLANQDTTGGDEAAATNENIK